MRSLLVLTCSLFLIAACGGDSTTSGAGGDGGPSSSGGGPSGVVGGNPGEVEPPEGTAASAAPPAENELPAPEFKNARTALQQVTETVASIGTTAADKIATAEQAILLGDSAKADEMILEVVAAIGSDPKIRSEIRGSVLAALATDIAKYQDYPGKPSVTVTEHKDRCCDETGACSVELATATCWEVKHGEAVKGCAGECEEARPEPTDEGDTEVKAEEKDAAQPDDAGKGDAEPAAEGAAAPAAEPAAEGSAAPATEGEAEKPAEGEGAEEAPKPE